MDNATTDSKKIQAAYASIASFFDAWSLPCSRRYLNRLLKATMDTKPTKMNPSTVLYFFKTLETLVNGALQIHYNQGEREEAILHLDANDYPNLDNYADYFGWHLPSHPWLFFPRSLSVKEYANPYRVFDKIAGYAGEEKWKFILSELQDFCFYKSSFAECGEEFNALVLHRLLQKLLEAAHLIDVRAISEVAGKKRMKWPLQEAALSDEAKLHKTIRDFFSQWKIEELDRDLFQMLKAYLAGGEYGTTPTERSNAIFNYETLVKFLKELNDHAGRQMQSFSG